MISLLSIFILSAAYQIAEGVIKTNGRELEFSKNEETSVPVIFNDTSSKLDLSFKILGSSHPDQAFVKISNEDEIETSLKVIIKSTPDSEGYNAKLSISYEKLPSLFKTSPSLKMTLIVAGYGDSEPILTSISSIELTEELISLGVAKYERPQRFVQLPEIHHIFQNPPKYVNSAIAVVFATGSVISLFGLLGVWGGLGLVNFKNLPSDGGKALEHIIFILLIVGYEVVFFQYYLGSTIFSTIAKVFILLGPTVFLGSKVLNYVGSLRLAGKR